MFGFSGKQIVGVALISLVAGAVATRIMGGTANAQR